MILNVNSCGHLWWRPPVLFYAGGALVYCFVLPSVLAFFLSFGGEGIDTFLSVKTYLSLFIQLVFAFGLAFELPVLLLVLMAFGVVSRQRVASFRKYAMVLIVLFAAIMTPPDPTSQLLLALPMILLYEVTLLIAKVLQIGMDK